MFKNCANYVVIDTPDYGYFKDDKSVLVQAYESTSDTMVYKLIKNGKVILEYAEDDCAHTTESLIDAFFTLKYGTSPESKIKVHKLDNEDTQKLFSDSEVPDSLASIR